LIPAFKALADLPPITDPTCAKVCFRWNCRGDVVYCDEDIFKWRFVFLILFKHPRKELIKMGTFGDIFGDLCFCRNGRQGRLQVVRTSTYIFLKTWKIVTPHRNPFRRRKKFRSDFKKHVTYNAW